MSTPSRSALITKTHRVLKKHYKSVPPDSEWGVIEHLLYACLLENAPYALADEAFGRLQEEFFDWNEVRVSSVKELAEVCHRLPDPIKAAGNLRSALQDVFEGEARYRFHLEDLRKENLGAATKKLEDIRGATPFVVAYTVQSALGGHSIPVDRGVLDVMAVIGVISPSEREEGVVPGMERAIAKSKGIEFGSLLHQLGADFVVKETSPTLHKVLLEVNPQCKDRLPKRTAKKAAASISKERPRKKPAGQKSKSPAKKAGASTKTAASKGLKRKPR